MGTEAAKTPSTQGTSQAVPHPSTDRAMQQLTTEVGEAPVYLLRCGRELPTSRLSAKVSTENTAVRHCYMGGRDRRLLPASRQRGPDGYEKVNKSGKRRQNLGGSTHMGSLTPTIPRFNQVVFKRSNHPTKHSDSSQPASLLGSIWRRIYPVATTLQATMAWLLSTLHQGEFRLRCVQS